MLIRDTALPATGLVQTGSLLTYAWRVLTPPGTDAKALAAAIRTAFPATGWRIRDAAEAAPGVARAVEQTSLFLTLVGLCSLLVGGIGVATGVRAWMEARARTVATLRCLGASAGLILRVFLLQVGLLCLAGVAIGVVVGAAAPVAGLLLFGDLLPVPASAGIYPGPLALAALYGVLTAGAFALWPLARAAQIPGAALFRDALLPAGRGVPAPVWLANGLLVAAAGGHRGRRRAGPAVRAVVLRQRRRNAAGVSCWRLRPDRSRPPGAPAPPPFQSMVALRLGIANLHRPASPAPLLLVALGLGLTTLAAVALIQGNIRQQILGGLPQQAPSFFFIDIQNEQLAQFEQIVHAQPGATDLHQVPSLRARIVALKGVPVDQVHVKPGSEWALRGDRGLTYSAAVPRGSSVVAGQWWPAGYDGPPLVSLDRRAGRRVGAAHRRHDRGQRAGAATWI